MAAVVTQMHINVTFKYMWPILLLIASKQCELIVPFSIFWHVTRERV